MIPLKDNVGAGGFPALTIALIVLCVLAFGWQLTRSGSVGSGDVPGLSERDVVAAEYAAVPARIADRGESGDVDGVDQVAWWASPVTAFFVSADLLHLVINLLFLWIFGRTLEVTLGRLRFGGLLVLAALAAAGAQALVDGDSDLLILSASSVLAGALGAYAVIYSRAAVLSLSVIPLFGTLIDVPALLLIASWFLIALIPAVGAVVDPDLVAGAGLEFAGYGVALALGALGGLLARGRRIDEPRPMPV